MKIKCKVKTIAEMISDKDVEVKTGRSAIIRHKTYGNAFVPGMFKFAGEWIECRLPDSFDASSFNGCKIPNDKLSYSFTCNGWLFSFWMFSEVELPKPEAVIYEMKIKTPDELLKDRNVIVSENYISNSCFGGKIARDKAEKILGKKFRTGFDKEQDRIENRKDGTLLGTAILLPNYEFEAYGWMVSDVTKTIKYAD